MSESRAASSPSSSLTTFDANQRASSISSSSTTRTTSNKVTTSSTSTSKIPSTKTDTACIHHDDYDDDSSVDDDILNYTPFASSRSTNKPSSSLTSSLQSKKKNATPISPASSSSGIPSLPSPSVSSSTTTTSNGNTKSSAVRTLTTTKNNENEESSKVVVLSKEEIERKAQRIANRSYIPKSLQSPTQLYWYCKTKKKSTSKSRKRRKSTATVNAASTTNNESTISKTKQLLSKYEIHPCRQCHPDEIIGLHLNQKYDRKKQIPVEFIDMMGCTFRNKLLVNKSTTIPFYGYNDDADDDARESVGVGVDGIKTNENKKLQWNQEIMKQWLQQEQAKVKKGNNNNNNNNRNVEIDSRAVELFLERILDLAIENETKNQLEEEKDGSYYLDNIIHDEAASHLPLLKPSKKDILSKLKIGSRVAVYWQDDKTFYKGTLAKPTKRVTKDRTPCHIYTLKYDDGSTEKNLDLSKEEFKLLDDDNNDDDDDDDNNDDDTMTNISSARATSLSSNTNDTLHEMDTKQPAKGDAQSPSPVPLRKPSKEDLLSKLKIGSHVAVYWPEDKTFYKGILAKPTKRVKKDRKNNIGTPCYIYNLKYDDGSLEKNLDLSKEEFKLLDDDDDDGEDDTMTPGHTSAMLISQEIDDGESLVHDKTDDENDYGNGNNKTIHRKNDQLDDCDSDSDSDLSDFDQGYKHKSEPLRALDVIEYYKPIAIFGDKRFLEVAQILSVEPRGNPILTLSNGEYLESDTKVKRVKRILRGTLVDHDGRYRAISEYKLSTSKAPMINGQISGVQMKAKELADILKEEKQKCIEAVKAAGLGDCSDFLHKVGK